MIELCKKSGNKPPKFEESTGSFTVILPFKEPISRITSKTTISESTYDISSLNERLREMLMILKAGPMSREQIAGLLKKATGTRTLQRDLSKLKNLGLIAQTGSGKNIIWTLSKK